MRAAISIPIDIYLETPDGMGGIVRGHELADFVMVGAQLYTKFGLANASGVYPSGGQVVETAFRQRTGKGSASCHRSRMAEAP